MQTIISFFLGLPYPVQSTSKADEVHKLIGRSAGLSVLPLGASVGKAECKYMADHSVVASLGTSYMKARLLSLRCFVLNHDHMLPQKTLATLASSSNCSVLFHCAYELLCF